MRSLAEVILGLVSPNEPDLAKIEPDTLPRGLFCNQIRKRLPGLVEVTDTIRRPCENSFTAGLLASIPDRFEAAALLSFISSRCEAGAAGELPGLIIQIYFVNRRERSRNIPSRM